MPKSRQSLTRQVQCALDAKLRIGESKHEAKKDGSDRDGIYAWNTYKTYLKHCNYFVAYCKETYGCRTLTECHQYADEWLATRAGLSACTQALEISALGKLYGCTAEDFAYKAASISRDNIKRSRGEAIRDKGYSDTKNATLTHFCEGLGPRNICELQKLLGQSHLTRSQIEAEIPRLENLDKLTKDEKKDLAALRAVYAFPEELQDFVRLEGKGGKVRYAPVVGPYTAEILDRIDSTPAGKKVWKHVNTHADVHAMRREYATQIYKAFARPLEVCKRERFYNSEHYNGKGKRRGGWDRDSVYHMRGSCKGIWLDKRAMLYASLALGHNRISVVGEHYIRV